jgi:hypothetical protein
VALVPLAGSLFFMVSSPIGSERSDQDLFA